MLRIATALAAIIVTVGGGGCAVSRPAIRSVPRLLADEVGKPIDRLQTVFGAPRRIDTTATQQVYFWFLDDTPAGAPRGFHGCQVEVTVDGRSDRVLGYSMSNLGWGKCAEIKRREPATEPVSPR